MRSCVASGTAPSSPKAEASAEFPACNESVWTCKGKDCWVWNLYENKTIAESTCAGKDCWDWTGGGSKCEHAPWRLVPPPAYTECMTLISSLKLRPVASSRPRLSAFEHLLHMCRAVAFALVWITGTVVLGGITYELCKAWYGRPPPFAVAATLAFVVDASLTAVSLKSPFPSASLNIYILLLALCFGWFGWYGADLARAAAGAPHAHRTTPLAPSTVWPSDLHVESFSPSAPVPPSFVCPITMAPMANPAMTPRGTTYDREALCAWITKQHRYPGGEARAQARKALTHIQRL